MNRITEEQMRREAVLEDELALPMGADPSEAIEDYFGISATAREDMPDDADVEGAVLIKFK